MVSLKERLNSYFEPTILLFFSLYYLPYTLIYSPPSSSNPAPSGRSGLKTFGYSLAPEWRHRPLQVNHIDTLLRRAQGTVLELGPGGGDQMFHYDSAQVTRMLGAEPNAFLHPKLQQKAADAGIKSFFAIEAGAQPSSLLPALKKAGVITGNLPDDGIFDSIVAVKSLCSAPQKEMYETVAVIQALLKPGGEFLFFEHLGNNDDKITRVYASVIDLVWPMLMGGCRLDGKLDKVVMGMGGWDDRDLHTTGEFKGTRYSDM